MNEKDKGQEGSGRRRTKQPEEEVERKDNPDDEPPENKSKLQTGGVVCNCPQRCGDRVGRELRVGLLARFQELEEHSSQNSYLQSYIEVRSVYKRLWCQEERVKGRLQRRVSCKYKLPITIPSPLVPAHFTYHPPTLTTNSKGKMTFIVGSNTGVETVEVCQKAFMNVYGITEKRIRLQREKLIARLRNDTAEAAHLSEGNNNNNRGTGGERATNRELAIVDTFFRNQLWKPEYITSRHSQTTDST